MIDIHTHVLPGVDDGAGSLLEAAAMCRMAAADGCEALVATPHQRTGTWFNGDPDFLAVLLRELQEEIGERPRLHLGGEIRIDEDLLAELDDLPRSGLIPLAGSRYLLLEFNRDGSGPDPAGLVRTLVEGGWRPILAHPEFIPRLDRNPPLVEELVGMGALLQVTAMSVTGDFGPERQRSTRRYLEAGLAHFVASDSHGSRWRPPGLSRARATIAATWGEELAERLTSHNPRAVIEDRTLSTAAEPVPARDAGRATRGGAGDPGNT